MAEVLRSFDAPVTDALGTYQARAVGRHAADGMWEGWIEFVPADGNGDVLVTSVESRQPEHTHLLYWAGGLTSVYVEGALKRARNPTPTIHVRAPEQPASTAPARTIAVVAEPRGPAAVLDPFAVGTKSLDILGQELGALDRPRLLNIIDAYTLNRRNENLSTLTDAQLVRFIVVAVEAQLVQRNR
jgi:hypothetical protein